MTARMPAWCNLLLLSVSCLLLTSQCSASTLPCAAAEHREQILSCLNNARIERLDALLLKLINDPSNLGPYATVQGYLQDRPAYAAEAVLSYATFQTRTLSDDTPPNSVQLSGAQATTATDAQALASEARMDASTLPLPSLRRRQLMQLSGSFSDFQVSNGKLTGFTRRDTRVTSPDNSLQAVRNEYSGFSTPVSKELQEKLEQIAPSLVQASSAFQGDAEPSAAAAAAAEANATVVGTDSRQQNVQPSLRIVGGVEAPTDRKYVCSLRTPSTSNNPNFLFCGCSLIAPNVVLTAAHCLTDTNLRTPWVEIGRYYQQKPNDTAVNDHDRIKCTAGVPNRAWSDTTGQNDIALCFLETPSRFEPVKLADQVNIKLTANQELTVMGWGATSEGGSQSNALMAVDIVTTDLQTCRAAFSNEQISGSTQICAGVLAGGKDACQGDSGGPLIIKGATADEDVLVGIVSYGVGCARPNLPGIYTDVRAYREWIAQQLLARGISYPNLTDAFAEDSAGIDQETACACTSDGNSGSTFLGTNLAGCKQHGLSVGDTDYYCYVKGGSDCLDATSSTSYPGSAWVDCTPEVKMTSGSNTQNPARPGTQDVTPASTASLLGSMLGAWLASPGRIAPNMTAALAPASAAGGNGTAGASFAVNRTANAARRGAGVVGMRAVQPAVLG